VTVQQKIPIPPAVHGPLGVVGRLGLIQSPSMNQSIAAYAVTLSRSYGRTVDILSLQQTILYSYICNMTSYESRLRRRLATLKIPTAGLSYLTAKRRKMTREINYGAQDSCNHDVKHRDVERAEKV
jgi:hypothetical protein